MTVSVDAARVVHVANGVTTLFSTAPIEGVTASNLVVTLTAPNGAVTTPVAGVDYTLTPSGVSFTVAPADQTRVLLRRIVPLTQPASFPTNTPFPAQTVETRLDQVAFALQQQREEGALALRAAPSDIAPPPLPPAAIRANTVLGFDASGNPEVRTVTGTEIISYAQWAGSAGGTANALTLTPSPALGGYAAGVGLEFVSASANTGAATVNVSGLGVRNIRRQDGSALSPGDIPANALISMRFDGADFRLVTTPAGSAPSATTSTAGTARLATQAEVNTGTLTNAIVVPETLALARRATRAQSTAYTVVAADNGRTILATGTWVLGALAAATLGTGFRFSVRNAGSGTITFDPNGAETVDGSATFPLSPGSAATFETDGVSWVSISRTDAAAGRLIAYTEFTASGTWTPNAATTRYMIFGRAGGSRGSWDGGTQTGAGGVAGFSGLGWFTGNPGPQAVTVGAGVGQSGALPAGETYGPVNGGGTGVGALFSVPSNIQGARSGVMLGVRPSETMYVNTVLAFHGADNTASVVGDALANSGAGGNVHNLYNGTIVLRGSGSGLVRIWEYS